MMIRTPAYRGRFWYLDLKFTFERDRDKRGKCTVCGRPWLVFRSKGGPWRCRRHRKNPATGLGWPE